MKANRRAILGAIGSAPLISQTGAETRPMRPGWLLTDRKNDGANFASVNLLDRINPGLHPAIADGSYSPLNPAYDVTAAFEQALTTALAHPNGGEVVIPAGVYTMSMDLADPGPSDFARSLRIAGAGRGCTVIRPAKPGSTVLNLEGRSRATIQDLTIRSGEAMQAACGIYVGRSRRSPNANNNKFLNLEIEGNFARHAVVSCGAESSLWFNCRIAPNAGGNLSGFWTGTTPDLAGMPGIADAVVGPNSDNRMIACEFYMPFAGAQCLTISRAGAWLVDASSFIVGPVARGGARLVVIKDFDGQVFNGPVHLRDCHFEVLGPATTGVYVEGAGLRYVYDLSISKGFAVVGAAFVMVDYEGRAAAPAARGLYLLGGDFTAPATSSGEPTKIDLSINAWAIERVHVHWRTRGGGGVVSAPGFVKDSLVDAANLRTGRSVNTLILRGSPAIENPRDSSVLPRPSGSSPTPGYSELAEALAKQEATIDKMLAALRGVGIVAI